MKNFLTLLYTNWINLVGIFLTTYIYGVIVLAVKSDNPFYQILMAILFAVIFYGVFFWVIFLIGISILDFLIIQNTKRKLRHMLILEWLIISSPFVYWFSINSEWIFLIAIITFLFTQILRERKIKQLKLKASYNSL